MEFRSPAESIQSPLSTFGVYRTDANQLPRGAEIAKTSAILSRLSRLPRNTRRIFSSFDVLIELLFSSEQEVVSSMRERVK